MSEFGPASCADVEAVLGKVLGAGQLARIPRHPTHRAVVLGIICLGLERRYPYSEIELNDLLTEELAKFRADVDHVTCRRFLVDLGFVKRDRAGTRYYLNYPELELALSESARQHGHALLERALIEADERLAQRRRRPASSGGELNK